MSSIDDEPIDFDDDVGANGFCPENPQYDENCDMKADCEHDKGGDFEVKYDIHQGGPMRPMRPMRPQYRSISGPRPPFQCNFRGPPRGLPPGPGGMRGFPYMRPGMAPNPSGPPFDFNGPPPIGMPRNCAPPGFPPGPPRFPPMNEPIKEEEANEPSQNYDMNRNSSDYEMAPPNSNAFPNFPPSVRSHGPPPFINGPPNGMPGGPPPNNQGFPGPAPGPPFAPPPGVPFSGPPATAQQGTPYSAPMFTSTNAPPFNNVPTSCHPFGAPPGQNFAPNPPFNSPPAPFNGPFGGPGGPSYPHSGQHYPSQSNMDAAMSGPPPPHAASAPPVVAPSPQACPQPVVSHATQPVEASGPQSNAPRFAPPTEMPHFSPPISSGAPVRHPLENQPGQLPNTAVVPVAPVPPIGMPPASSISSAPFPTALPPVMAGMHPPMPHIPNGPPRCELPPIPTVHPGFPPLPMHMMPPPIPSIIPPFRPAMPQMAPMVMGAATVKPASDDIWVENFTAEGKPYYYSMRTRETRWDRPENVTIVRQGEVENTQSLPVQSTADSNVSSVKGQKPPEVAVWGEYKNPEGKSYYHNSKTGETTWEKPKVLIEYEGAQKSVQSGTTKSEQPSIAVAPVSQSKPPTSVTELTQQPVTKGEPGKPADAAVIDKVEVKPVTEPRKNDDGDDKAAPTKPKDTSRPVSSTAVPGTPWCVVWTGDDRAFFFNPSQRLSVWERPEELKGRVDVDRLLEKPVVSNANQSAAAQGQTANADDAADGASAAKKAKMETEEIRSGVMDPGETSIDAVEEKEQDNVNQGQDKIAVGMEAAKEAEERAARERAVQPLEIRIRRFREMLVEMQVSAFSTWEKELHKIVFDPRYLLLTSKERKQTFEAYVKERADEERKEKKNKLKECRDKFHELLEEARLTTKSTFTEVSAKYAKDDRFRAIEKNRDRESMFQDFLSELRKKEKEDKNRDKEKDGFAVSRLIS